MSKYFYRNGHREKMVLKYWKILQNALFKMANKLQDANTAPKNVSGYSTSCTLQ